MQVLDTRPIPSRGADDVAALDRVIELVRTHERDLVRVAPWGTVRSVSIILRALRDLVERDA